jgi:membrane protease YdiL (CAAX protease family)
MLCLVIADLMFIALLVFIFYKDLKVEFKTYFSDFKNKFKNSFKIYILGYMGMLFFNVLIAIVLKDISSNESQVRELLYNNTVLTLFSIAIIAPLSEELVFRKSLAPLFKNKWIYVVISGLLFGGAHLLTNLLNDAFSLKDLMYILPYGCLGASFALMDYNSKSTFSSIVIHSMHNTITGILLLITYFGGK